MKVKGLRSEPVVTLTCPLVSLPTGSGAKSTSVSPRLTDSPPTRVRKYIASIKIKLTSAVAEGSTVDVYLVTTNGGLTDGGLVMDNTQINSTSVSTAKPNLYLLGSIQTNGSVDLVGSLEFETWSETFGLLVVNSTGQALTSTDSDHKVAITPVAEFQ